MTTNLAGSLDTFGLDEVLSMLAMGGRSAHMEVSSPQGDGEIRVVDGHVSAATADRRRATLLRQLVAAAEVPAADLAAALEGADAVRALVDSGSVERGFAHGVAVEQIVDALGEMLTWGEGQFAVQVGAEHAGDIGVRLPMDEAVGRGRGRADEWVRVRSALPGEHEVLALAPSVAEGASLGRDDWAVLVRVDGRRTLGEVVAAAGCAPLVASDRIVDLMGRGLVRVRAESADRPDEVAQLLDSVEGSHADAAAPVLDANRGLDQVDMAPGLAESDFAYEEVALAETAAESAGVLVEDEDAHEVVAQHVPAEDVVPLVGLAAVALADDAEGADPVGLADGDVDVHGVVEAVPETDPVPVLVVADEPLAWESAAEQQAASDADDVVDPATPEPHVVAEASADAAVEPAIDYAALVPPADAEVAVEADGEFRFPVEVEPVAWAPEPEAWDLTAEEGAPQQAGVAGAVEWSPWAQALGLGAPAPEGELVADPLAGPGIAEMIAGAHAAADTELVPVPLAPTVDTDPVAADPEPELPVAAGLPEPRVSAEAVDVPVGVEAEAAEAEVPALAEPAVEAAPDPLAGGLLAHLMSGVRGM